MGVRHILRAFVPAALALSLGPSVPAPTAAAARVPTAVDPALTIHSVTLSRAAVAVSGLNVVPVEVRVSASYDPARPDVPLSVMLDRAAPGGSLLWMTASNLPRVSGTAAAGVWAGTLHVPSTAGGSFKVTGVAAGFDSPGTPLMTEPTPFDGPTLAITGLHQPKITATTYPNPVPVGSAYALGGKVVDSATGLPYPTRITVEIGVDNTCVEYGGVKISSTTAGTFAHRLPASSAEWVNCAQLKNGTTFIEGVAVLSRRPGELGAWPSATSGRVGTSIPVYGTARNAKLCPVELQRLRGSTQWRQVALSRVRESGRITLLAPLTEAGAPIFRVYLPRCKNYVDAATTPFGIRAS